MPKPFWCGWRPTCPQDQRPFRALSSALRCGQDRAGLPKDVDKNRIPDADLFVTEIGIFPRLDQDQYGEIYDEITLAISDLVYEQPHAYDYLRGRTFARTLH